MLRTSTYAAALLLAACQPDRQPTTEQTAPPSLQATPSTAPDSVVAPAENRPDAATTDSAFLIRRGYVGPLRLNMKEGALLAAVPESSLRKTTRTLEGITYPVYEYRAAGTPATTAPLLLEMVGDEEEGYRLWRVQVRDGRYRTAEAVGVGGTYGEARQAYGIQTIERTEAGVVAVSERLNASWILDAKTLPATGQLRKDDIPPATQIVGVILFR
ncbi:hypothetical protein [Solirubrum puertoriconensis]|uniref:Lipoprotein n=1 Tax=Solirubrum puertoriconensis TaxID=1751427 RepID=A0A9X0HKL5_SOLP1|nr:hypothetical protein [Solirubrum puertoriconensis]KUG07666.1 hypothetical protein ASU33_15180 [Solirubrum puertoriconensis]